MIKIRLDMKKGKDKEFIEAVAKPAQLVTRFSSVAEAWKTYRGLIENKQKAICKRNVVFQEYPDKTEIEVADIAESQANKVLKDMRKNDPRLKFELKRETIK